MTFIAVLLVVTLIGLFVTIGFIIAVVLNFRKIPSRIVQMTTPTKNSAIEVFNTGKGIAEVGKIRYNGYVKHGARIYSSVKNTAGDFGTAAKSVNVGDAAGAVRKAAETINAAQESLAAAKAVLDILGRSAKE